MRKILELKQFNISNTKKLYIPSGLFSYVLDVKSEEGSKGIIKRRDFLNKCRDLMSQRNTVPTPYVSILQSLVIFMDQEELELEAYNKSCFEILFMGLFVKNPKFYFFSLPLWGMKLDPNKFSFEVTKYIYALEPSGQFSKPEDKVNDFMTAQGYIKEYVIALNICQPIYSIFGNMKLKNYGRMYLPRTGRRVLSFYGSVFPNYKLKFNFSLDYVKSVLTKPLSTYEKRLRLGLKTNKDLDRFALSILGEDDYNPLVDIIEYFFGDLSKGYSFMDVDELCSRVVDTLDVLPMRDRDKIRFRVFGPIVVKFSKWSKKPFNLKGVDYLAENLSSFFSKEDEDGNEFFVEDLVLNRVTILCVFLLLGVSDYSEDYELPKGYPEKKVKQQEQILDFFISSVEETSKILEEVDAEDIKNISGRDSSLLESFFTVSGFSAGSKEFSKMSKKEKVSQSIRSGDLQRRAELLSQSGAFTNNF